MSLPIEISAGHLKTKTPPADPERKFLNGQGLWKEIGFNSSTEHYWYVHPNFDSTIAGRNKETVQDVLDDVAYVPGELIIMLPGTHTASAVVGGAIFNLYMEQGAEWISNGTTLLIGDCNGSIKGHGLIRTLNTSLNTAVAIARGQFDITLKETNKLFLEDVTYANVDIDYCADLIIYGTSAFGSYREVKINIDIVYYMRIYGTGRAQQIDAKIGYLFELTVENNGGSDYQQRGLIEVNKVDFYNAAQWDIQGGRYSYRIKKAYQFYDTAPELPPIKVDMSSNVDAYASFVVDEGQYFKFGLIDALAGGQFIVRDSHIRGVQSGRSLVLSGLGTLLQCSNVKSDAVVFTNGGYVDYLDFEHVPNLRLP